MLTFCLPWYWTGLVATGAFTLGFLFASLCRMPRHDPAPCRPGRPDHARGRQNSHG